MICISKSTLTSGILSKSNDFIKYCFSDKIKFSELSYENKRSIRILECARNRELKNFVQFFKNFPNRSPLLCFVGIMNFEIEKDVYEIIRVCNYPEINFLLRIFKNDTPLITLIQRIQENKFLEIHNFLNNKFYDVALTAIENGSKKDPNNDVYNSGSDVTPEPSDLMDYYSE